MDKQEQRAIMKYIYKKGLTPNAIYDDMTSTLGKYALLNAAVKSVLFCASFGLTERSSPPLQTSKYRRQHTYQRLPETTRITGVVTPSKLSCSLLCLENVECKSFRFVVSTTVCQLHNEVPYAAETSTKYDRRVYYVRASVVKTKGEGGQQALTTGTWTGKTRILFTHPSVDTQLSQLTHERNTSICTTYRVLPRVRVTAMDYSPILGRIFMATEKPINLISTVLDSTKTTFIRRGYYTSLSVDARNKMLLCAKRGLIHSMTTDGRLFKLVYTAPSKGSKIKDVVVDSTAGMVFFAQCRFFGFITYSLMSMDYSGKDVQVYLSDSGSRIWYLAFDPIAQRLVYNLNHQVKQFNRTSHTHSDLTSTYYMYMNIAGIVVDGGIVYIMNGNTLNIFERGTFKAYIHLPHSDNPYCFCVIH